MEKAREQIFNFVIADDDPDDQHMLQKVIWDSNRQHKITAVYNGMQLLEYLFRKGAYKNCTEPRPDCIFLDLNMPLINGWEVLKKIRETNDLKDLRVYVLTTDRLEPRQKQLLKEANGLYQKNPANSSLRTMLEDVLEQMQHSTPA
jgi:CheY-like chemotaxis protein